MLHSIVRLQLPYKLLPTAGAHTTASFLLAAMLNRLCSVVAWLPQRFWRPTWVEAVLLAIFLLQATIAAARAQHPGWALDSTCLWALAALALFVETKLRDYVTGRYEVRGCPRSGLAQGLLALPLLTTSLAFTAKSGGLWLFLSRCLLASSFQLLAWLLRLDTKDENNSQDAADSNTSDGFTAIKPLGRQQPAGGRRRKNTSAAAPTARSQDLKLKSAAPSAKEAQVPTAAPMVGQAAEQHLRHGWQHAASALRTACLCASGLAAMQAWFQASQSNPLTPLMSTWPVPAQPHNTHSHSFLQRPPASPTALMLLAALALGCKLPYHVMMRQLPRCFTLGEGAIASQAMSLVAGLAAVMLHNASRQGWAHLLWSTHVQHPDPGMQVPAFIVMIHFWLLMLSLCMWGAHSRLSASLHSLRALCLVLALGSTAMLLDLALWVLGRFLATSTGLRLRTLAYWFTCLAVSVPAMYWVAQHSQPDAPRRHRHAAQTTEEDAEDTHANGNVSNEAELNTANGSAENGHTDGDARDVQSSGNAQRAMSPHMPLTRKARNAGQRSDAGSAAANGPSSDTKAALLAVPTRGIEGQIVQAANQKSAEQDVAHEVEPATQFAPRRTQATSTAHSRAWIPHIIMRKGYHILALLLFLPAFVWDLRMLQASLAIAHAALLSLELVRKAAPAPVSFAIQHFMANFADSRDKGPIYVTHLTLLLGMALPVWLADAACDACLGGSGLGNHQLVSGVQQTIDAGQGTMGHVSDWAARLDSLMHISCPGHDCQHRLCLGLVGLSGLVSLGIGDTAASAVGYLYGKHKMFVGYSKTWEGTLAGVGCMLGAWMAMAGWGLSLSGALSWRGWLQLCVATVVAGHLEAITQQLDNLVVPVFYAAQIMMMVGCQTQR